MSVPIHVRPATVDDVPEIQAAEVAATERFRAIEDPRIARCADAAPYWTAGLERASIEQRAWVAVDDRGSIIGFAVAWVVDGEGHLDELAVTPGYGRRGVGRARAIGREGVSPPTRGDGGRRRPTTRRKRRLLSSARLVA